MPAEKLLRFTDGVFSEVEDAGGDHGVGSGLSENLRQMREISGSTAGNHRHADSFTHPARDFDVEARFCAVGVDAVEDNLARSQFHRPDAPLDGLEPGGFASPVRKHFPPVRCDLFAVDGDDDALAPEFLRALPDEFGSRKRGGVDARRGGRRSLLPVP